MSRRAKLSLALALLTLAAGIFAWRLFFAQEHAESTAAARQAEILAQMHDSGPAPAPALDSPPQGPARAPQKVR